MAEDLQVGLLMTEEADVMSEDDEELYSFQHKLIHEYVAACYIAQQIVENSDFLPLIFKTLDDILSNVEIVGFCAHIFKTQLKARDHFIEHITNIYACIIFEECVQKELITYVPDFLYDFAAVMSYLLPVFGSTQHERETEFTKVSRAFIKEEQTQCYIYASQSSATIEDEKVLMFIAISAINELYNRLSRYQGITHLHIRNDVVQTGPKILTPDDRTYNFEEIIKRQGHNIKNLVITDMDMIILHGLLFACQDKNMREVSIKNMSGNSLGSPTQLNIAQFTASRFHSSGDYLGKT